MDTIYAIIFIIGIFYIIDYIINKYILPKLIEMDIKRIEKNPKWIMKDVEDNYYGFQDIDIILAETNKFVSLPRMRMSKDCKYELLIPNDTPTREVDNILRLALAGKIAIKYGLNFTDKPLHWLSILCYMLDGGDIKATATKLKRKQEVS